jgi:phasin family protein
MSTYKNLERLNYVASHHILSYDAPHNHQIAKGGYEMNEYIEKYYAPVRELNNLAITNMEKVLEMQLKFIEDSTKAGLDSLKTAAAINDAEGLKEYLNSQVATSKQFTERALEDGRAAAELGNDYIKEAQNVVKEALTTPTAS